jgi:hypothetical protein
MCVNPAHLRIATSKQSRENRPLFRTNTSGARGVYFDPRGGKWRAQVGHHGQRAFIGSFVTCEDAAVAARDVRDALFTHNFTVVTDAGRRYGPNVKAQWFGGGGTGLIPVGPGQSVNTTLTFDIAADEVPDTLWLHEKSGSAGTFTRL